MGASNKTERDIGVKEKIRNIVVEYIRLFPYEYEAVREDIRTIRMNLRNQFGSGDSVVLDREIVRLPETLDMLFKKMLTAEEEMWLFGENKKGGKKSNIRWFAREFSGFRVPDKI